MKALSRLLALFLIISVLALVGCLGGDDDDDYVASTGEILLSADVDAPGTAVFAAALRGSIVGELRAAKSTKFKALIKLAGNRVGDPKDLELSADGKKLTMAETTVTAATGKQQVTIEVVNELEKPILKTIVVAEVVATPPVDKKSTKVDTETTARAVAYEAWDKKTTNAFDEFPATVDITTLKTQIETTLGNSIDGSKDLTDSAIQTKATEVAKDVEPVVEPVATKNRFSGNYRFFQLNASIQNRWVGMSEVTVSGNQFSGIVKLDPDPAEINTTYSATFTEINGAITFSGDTTVRGAISPSGNIGLGHDWQASDPNIGLFIKKPTSASNATLNGTYRFYEFFDEVTSNFAPRGTSNITVSSIIFNGNGTYSSHSVIYKEPADEWVPEASGNYSVSSDGKISFDGVAGSEFTQVSADGNVIVTVRIEAGNACFFVVGIKQDSSLTTADMNGNWLYSAVNAGAEWNPYSYSEGQLVTFNNGSGNWTGGVSDVPSEVQADGTNTISVASNGTLTVDSGSYGSLAPNKELMAIVSKDGSKRFMNLLIKK